MCTTPHYKSNRFSYRNNVRILSKNKWPQQYQSRDTGRLPGNIKGDDQATNKNNGKLSGNNLGLKTVTQCSHYNSILMIKQVM